MEEGAGVAHYSVPVGAVGKSPCFFSTKTNWVRAKGVFPHLSGEGC